MRLIIFCEGETEQAVLRTFLAPFCEGFERVRVQSTDGNTKLKHEFKALAERELTEDPTAIALCLIDLLNAPFPYSKTVRNAENVYEAQYTLIKNYMESQIQAPLRNRFCAFPVMMEIETWLLADPEVLKYFRVRQQYDYPENVEHPAEELDRLMQQHKDRKYNKLRDGRLLFSRAHAQRVYDDQCPHFEDIIDQLRVFQNLPPLKPTRQRKQFDQPLYQEWANLYAHYLALSEKLSEDTPEVLDELIALEEQLKIIETQIGSQ